MGLSRWDCRRPLLAALVTTMHARRDTSFAVTENGVAFTKTNDRGRPVRDVTIPALLVDGTRHLVSFAALVEEQVTADDLFLATLSGHAAQYRATLPDHLAEPDRSSPQDRSREATITVFWEDRRAIVHRQLFINGIPASARTAAAYQSLVDLNTPHRM